MNDFPEPRYVQTNGIRMAVHEQGEGLPVVLCHGFPELACSWRHQVPALAKAGFRAIAPDQRGYGLTSCPPDTAAYSIQHLTGDLAGLLDALGIQKAVFCGHDWGGFVIWAMGQMYPDRVAGLIGVNTPFLPRAPMPPVQMMEKVMGPNFYIVYFQQPELADKRLAANPRRVFSQLFRRVPDAKAAKEAMKAAMAGRARERLHGLNLCDIAEGPDVPGDLVLSDGELDFYAERFARTGFTGGINWYRNMNRNWETTAALPPKILAPSLMVTAENDFALSPAMAAGMPNLVPDLETHLIKDCGHWTQQEKPAELNAVMTGWLTRRFG